MKDNIGLCDLNGCTSKKITVTMDMYHDDGRFRKHVLCCSLAHAATFCIAYADREESNWDINIPSQKTINRINSLVEAMIDDPDYKK